MKKTILIGIIIIAVLIAAFLGYQYLASPKGDTVASREELLEEAKGGAWHIQTETELDGYIVSGAYSDNEAAIAVFAPKGEGKYGLQTTTVREPEESIISGSMIDDKWYDLIWFNGAQSEYAEIVYTTDGEEQEPLRFDTRNMNIIFSEAPSNDYNINVIYYDSEGNKYE